MYVKCEYYLSMYVENTYEYFNTMAAYEILGNILKDIETSGYM